MNRITFFYYVFISLALIVCFPCFGQQDSTVAEQPVLTMTGFVDVFYAYDFNEPTTDYRLPFVYNHNRHNEFNLNLGLIKLGIEHSGYRGNLALHAGTYANDNYVAEPGLLKNIFEANVGIALNKKNNFWLDAGVFSSNLGFESAVSTENMTLTRSLCAENSPYFLSGAKLTYTPNEKLEVAALISNGWQRIRRVTGSSLPSFGTQIVYAPSDNITLNWSTFVGTDDPDISRRMRYFNNLYGKIQLAEKIGLIAGFDIGAQQKVKYSTDYDIWFTPVLIAQYSVNKKWATAIRAEYYQDENEVIISTGSPNGFKTTGFSVNLDYVPYSNVAFRIEGRWLSSEDDIFPSGTSFGSTNLFVVGSLAVKFEK